MFESKSKAQVEAERRVMEGMEFFCGGRCAMVQVPRRVYQETGATESELEGVARHAPADRRGGHRRDPEGEGGRQREGLGADEPAGQRGGPVRQVWGRRPPGRGRVLLPGENHGQAAQEMKAACQAYLAELEAQGLPAGMTEDKSRGSGFFP